jgi:hypothetical protein
MTVRPVMIWPFLGAGGAVITPHPALLYATEV